MGVTGKQEWVWRIEMDESEIRRAVREYVERQGYKVSIVEFSDKADKSLSAKVLLEEGPKP
jgi:DNA-binding response OmpR family regulator